MWHNGEYHKWREEKLSILYDYLEDYDMDNAESTVEDIKKVKYNDKFDDFFVALNKFVRDVEYQEAQTLINNYIRDCGSYWAVIFFCKYVDIYKMQ